MIQDEKGLFGDNVAKYRYDEKDKNLNISH